MFDFLRDVLPAVPSFYPFGDQVGPVITIGLALIWAAGFVYAAVRFIIGLIKLGHAKDNFRGSDMAEQKNALIWPLASMGGLAMVFGLVWAYLSIF
ncbi:MAG: hypothetical protein LBK54_06740 [Propionibacteriaceae bacterium]|jgi:hypothetical protein|nr:hypothetical protein [Propionibacteriaceae bacterium]